MGKFHIEGDWYLTTDPYSWILAKRLKKPTEKSEWADMTYHRTPEDALRHYFHLKQREAVGKAEDGAIKDMVDILFAENKRLTHTLKTAFSQVWEIELERKEVDSEKTEDD